MPPAPFRRRSPSSALQPLTRTIAVLIIFLLPLVLFLSACNTSASAKVQQVRVPGEVLVKFKAGVSQDRIETILKENGTALIAMIKEIGVHRVRIVSQDPVEAVLKRLAAYPEVQYVEPNFQYGLDTR